MGTLIFWQDAGASTITAIRMDAIQTEAPEDVLTITDHPVERGANVVDHARQEPIRLTIEGVVSSLPNRPIDSDASMQVIEFSVPIRKVGSAQKITIEVPKPPLNLTPSGLIGAGISELRGLAPLRGTFAGDTSPALEAVKARVLQQNAPRNRVRDVYEALLRAQTARTLVTVNTRDRDYFDMMIERVAKPRAVEDGNSAKFQIDFRQIRIASSKTVAAPQPAETRGKTSVSKGAQSGKKDEDPAQRRKTLLKAALDSLDG